MTQQVKSSNFDGGTLPDGKWTTDVNVYSQCWHEFGDVIASQFGGRMSCFGGGVGVTVDNIMGGVYVSLPIARVIYRLATGKDFLHVETDEDAAP